MSLLSSAKSKKAMKKEIEQDSDSDFKPEYSDSDLNSDADSDFLIEQPNKSKKTASSLATKPKKTTASLATESKNKKNNISTEGIKQDTDEYKKHKKQLTLCDCCHLHFSKNMITDSELGKICQHCYFFINFTNPESKYGWTLEKYINLCKDNHDVNNCEKYKNGNSCHICICLHDLKTMGKTQVQNNNNAKPKIKNITFSEPDKIHIFENADSDGEFLYI